MKKPSDMDGQSFLPLARGQIRFRGASTFSTVYYWEQNYPQTPTHFSLRGDTLQVHDVLRSLGHGRIVRYPGRSGWSRITLIHDPSVTQKTKNQMQRPALCHDGSSWEARRSLSIRLEAANRTNDCGIVTESKAADFPEAFIVDEPLRKELR